MKKLSKFLSVVLAAMLVAVMFAGCGESASNAASTAKSEATAAVSEAKEAATEAASEAKEAATEAASEVKEAATEAAAEIDPSVLGTFEFSFTCHDPDTSAKVIYMKSLCDEVYEKTNGGVTMTMYTGGTLVASTDVATAVEDGTADIGWLYTTFFPGEFVYTDIVTMPMTFDSSIQADEVLLDLIENNEKVQEELSRYHILSASTNPMNNIYTNKEITDASSFAGQNWRCTAGVATEMAKLLGVTPVAMGPGDIYESIEKNVLDGYIFEPSGVKSFNLQECTKYYLDTPVYCGVFLVVMNNDQWDSLPAEYQDIITEVWEKGSIGQTEVFMDDVEAAMPLFEDAGLTAVEADDAMIAALQDAADQYIASYIEANDCQDLYDEALSYKANH